MKKMKVVQCWDDGVLNDLKLAELFRKYNAKATFNLNPGYMTDERQRSYWIGPNPEAFNHNGYVTGRISRKDIAEALDGFEVASHCWKHENANTMPVSQWLGCAVQARSFLEDIVQRPCRGFAWPCGITTPETRDALRQAGFAYGRGIRNADFVTECEDVMELSPTCHYMDWAFYQRYQKAKECGVFYFWGHSYEMYEYDKLWEQLEMKIRFISEDPEAEWANVIDIVPLCKGGRG